MLTSQHRLFFASDSPEDVIRFIEEYPEFQTMYEQSYHICRNVEDVMGFFSEELRILDRNTVQYMIDEMQETIDTQKSLLDEQNLQIAELQRQLAELKNQ